MNENERKTVIRELLENHVLGPERAGQETRADFRQAFADIISTTGSERTAEFADRLHREFVNDNWVSPDLLRDMETHSPGSAKAVMDRFEELGEARRLHVVGEIEAHHQRLIARHDQVLIESQPPTFVQKCLSLMKATWHGFGKIHL